jgi:hypothetical protein
VVVLLLPSQTQRYWYFHFGLYVSLSLIVEGVNCIIAHPRCVPTDSYTEMCLYLSVFQETVEQKILSTVCLEEFPFVGGIAYMTAVLLKVLFFLRITALNLNVIPAVYAF